jgi:hypothetical protein
VNGYFDELSRFYDRAALPCGSDPAATIAALLERARHST